MNVLFDLLNALANFVNIFLNLSFLDFSAILCDDTLVMFDTITT